MYKTELMTNKTEQMADFVRELVSITENTQQLSMGEVCSRDELYHVVHVECSFYCLSLHFCTLFLRFP